MLNPRTQQRSAAFGSGDGDLMELRFMAGNADVQPGDLLITSGVDGVYPPGLPVATVVKVDRKVDSGFARISLQADARGRRRAPRAGARAAGRRRCRRGRSRTWRPPTSRRGDEAGSDEGARAMIMPRGTDQLLLPVNPLFIAASLVFALGFNLIPLGRQASMPDLLALVLVFWNVHQPLRVGVGIAFLLGLLMDVHQGALFGQHALAYTLLSFLAVTIHRRLLWFSVLEQALQVWPLFAARACVSLAGAVGSRAAASPAGNCSVRRRSRRRCGRWRCWVLLAPQRRAPDPDENRPL